MNRKRRREEEKMFNKVHQNHDLSGFDEAIKVLWNNNDFLYGRRVKSFDWIVDTLKYMVENKRKEKIEEYSYDFIHYSHMICYFSLIRKAIAFIKRNIENDALHRYAFIQSLYAINGFSGGEKNEGNYRDNLIVAPGIDVVLGHSCCRHKAGMLKSILDDFDDALTVSVGDDEKTPVQEKRPDGSLLREPQRGLGGAERADAAQERPDPLVLPLVPSMG